MSEDYQVGPRHLERKIRDDVTMPKGPGLPMQALYWAAKSAVTRTEGVSVKPSEVMAIAYLVSFAQPWLCMCSSADRQRIADLPFRSKAEKQAFVEKFRVKRGPNKGHIPRFRYRSRKACEHGAEIVSEMDSFVDQVAADCEWGQCGKMGSELLLMGHYDQYVTEFEVFLSEPDEQLALCVVDLDYYGANSRDDFALTAARYKNGYRLEVPNEFGQRAGRLARQFEIAGCK